jgi:aminoglycoside phosphotransferase (APT) family kinase protein
MGIVDTPSGVREGEALDGDVILAFLKERIDGIKGPLDIQQFPSGFSNLTYLVRAGGKEYVLRRPPFGKKAVSAHDMGREYRVLSALHPVFPYCPKPVAYTDDESIMGSPFYVMERIEGIILRRSLPSGFSLSPEQAEKLCQNMVDLHCDLHRLDYKAVGLETFGKPEGYVKRQVRGWSGRYRDSKTPDVPDFEEVIGWLEENSPADTAFPCIIHNDYKFDNLVLDPEDPLKIIGVLDWEMTTIGDPLMDLGSSLAYWVTRDDPEEMQLLVTQPTLLEGMITRRRIVDRYAQRSGRDIGNFDFYYAFGIFRLAVIAQQIYYRFYHGQTKDKRFASLGFGVTIFDKVAKRVIKGSGI